LLPVREWHAQVPRVATVLARALVDQGPGARVEATAGALEHPSSSAPAVPVGAAPGALEAQVVLEAQAVAAQVVVVARVVAVVAVPVAELPVLSGAVAK